MGTEATRSVIENYYAVLKTGRRDRIAECLSADCEFVPPKSAPIEPVRGGEAIARLLGGDLIKQMFDLSQPFGLEVHRIMADGDMAVVRQRMHGTAKSTGLPYENEYCWVYEVRDGRIARMEEFADTHYAAPIFGWG
ncbi:MAG: nuclear transport factor 2 family protein [Pseudomonadota bacterium]|nr:nuclear transport factor 2 family protein [Pseudomonadota bacterium]